MANKAIVVGASGLIGSELLKILLQQPHYDEVLILVRKSIAVNHPKLVQLIIDFDNLDKFADSITGDALFCCLGSTRKKTPDINAYYKIDHDYPVKLAQIALNNNIPQYHLVSALGASSKGANFYTKLKGETEEDIKNIHLKTLHIYQPSLLTGNRKEYRFFERISISLMRIIDPLLLGKLKKYRSIPAATVASAMFKQSIHNQEGIFIHPSDKITELK